MHRNARDVDRMIAQLGAKQCCPPAPRVLQLAHQFGRVLQTHCRPPLLRI